MEDAKVLAAEARGRVYVALSRGYLYPGPDLFEEGLQSGALVEELADALTALPAAGAMAGPLQALREALQRDLTDAPDRTAWEREYVRLWGQGQALPAPPYETEYTCSQLWHQQQEMADIAGFYRAFGVDITEGGDRPDFLGTELEFMYLLCTKEGLAMSEANGEAAEICRDAQAKFLQAHLGRWVGVVATLTADAAYGHFYVALCRFTDTWLNLEAELAGVTPEKAEKLVNLGKDGLTPAKSKGE